MTEQTAHQDLLSAVVRGWCTQANMRKNVDMELAKAITAELLPMFQSAISGAYEAAAKLYERLVNYGSDVGMPEVPTDPAYIAQQLRALTPADARQARPETFDTQHEHSPLPWRVREHPADPDEFHVSAPTPKDHPYFGRSNEIEVMSDEEYPTKRGDAELIVAAVNHLAAIASAEARGRLEEMVWLWGKDFGDAYNGGYLNERGRELVQKRIAAARSLTPAGGD